MGVGLGKNSPVQLSLNRENYEALIDRHGQWIRWRTASKCACVNRQTFQPDIHCKRCGGRGYIYSYQPKQITQAIVMAQDNSGILELSSEYENDVLMKVYDRSGVTYNNAEKQGRFIILNAGTVIKGHYFNIIMSRENVKTLQSSTLTKEGDYWIVPEVISTKEKTDGVYYSGSGDIISIGKIIDANNEEFEIEEFRLNKILLKTKTVTDPETQETTTVDPVTPLTATNIQYISPYTFALLNQNLNKADAQAMVDAQGDAICSYPYSCDVAEGDVLTVLAGTITQKDIIAKTSDKFDPLPAFFVSEIIQITGPDGTIYENGTDYVLSGSNRIKWLQDLIDAGEGYSVTYKVYPTYVVVRNIPQLRSSENQRFPKKAIVKYLQAYSEQRKVNRQ